MINIKYLNIIMCVIVTSFTASHEIKQNNVEYLDDTTISKIICFDGQEFTEINQRELPKILEDEPSTLSVEYTQVKNGFLLGIAHVMGLSGGYLLTYDIDNERYYASDEQSAWTVFDWPGYEFLSNGLIGLVDAGLVTKNDWMAIPKAFICDKYGRIFENQLKFNYGDEWISRGIAYDAELKQYVLATSNKFNSAVKVTLFHENGNLMKEVTLTDISYGSIGAKGYSSPPLYLFLMSNHDILLGTQPALKESWFVRVNLQEGTTSLLNDTQLEYLFKTEKINGQKTVSGWELSRTIASPPFTFQTTEHATIIFLNNLETASYLINAQYNTLVDWEPYGQNGFYAIFKKGNQ